MRNNSTIHLRQYKNQATRLPKFRILLLLTAVLFRFVTSTSFAAVTLFQFTSSPDSWVGHGYATYAVTPDMGWSFTAMTFTNHTYVQLRAQSLDLDASLDNYYWNLELLAPVGGSLSPGYYSGATRDGDGPPRMYLTGNNRGNNVIAGYFTINDIEFGAGATLNRLSVDFRQYDEGLLNRWVDGQWRFNAVPEPSTWMLLAIGLLTFFTVRLWSCRTR